MSDTEDQLPEDPRPGTRPLADTALGAFGIRLRVANAQRVVATMPAPSRAGDAGSVLVLAETVASTAAGLAAGRGRRAFGAELDAAFLARHGLSGDLRATATSLVVTAERHVWEIDVRDASHTLVLRGRCTLGVVDAPALD